MTLTTEKLNQGMTTQQYIEQIKVNKEPFIQIYEAVEIPDDVKAAFGSLGEPLTMAVFTADWCGDAMSTTPTILRLADSVGNLNAHVFNRDEELELTNSFLPENRAGTVPVFVVYDSSMNEVARFIETANELVPDIDAMDDVIAKELESEDPDNARTMRRGRRTSYRVERAREWGNVILQSFQRTVAGGLSMPPEKRPAIGGTKWPQ